MGPALVSRFHGLLRAARIYSPSNQTFQDQMWDLLRLVDQVMEGEVLLLAMGQCFYVNGVRIRADASQAAVFDALTVEFEQRKLGGVRFLEGLRSEELAVFLQLMLERPDGERAADLPAAAAAAGVVNVAAVTLAETESAGAETSAADEPPPQTERERTKQVFRQAVSGTRQAILHTARTGKPAMRRIKRVVQPIVDSVMKNEYSLIGLTAIKNHDEYTFAHCVNVSVLSVAMGHQLGLPRTTLANLGLAALLHDVGKLTVPPEVLGKPDQLSSEEWQLMERHPIEGVKIVARAPGLSTLSLDLLNVAFQHHLTEDGRGYPRLGRPCRLSAATRLVTVADCYDAMTAHRAYRSRPFTGYEALRLLLGPDRTRYDVAALWTLVRTVGLYPAGTLLMTNSGHLVISLSPNPEDMRRPFCRVLARPDGSMPPDAHPETWDPMPKDMTVSRVVSPEEFDGEIDRLIAA
ncbi:MAG TPA: HD domain-containing phosphohydrolase [Candidatus Udaeobacter sp.]|nr:HD domain-containing phosphohydrolase [Candidatus Udaeobacter sp.]